MIERKKPLRAQNTLENRLWARLKPLGFRRKAPFKSFTLDFTQHDAGLVVLLARGLFLALVLGAGVHTDAAALIAIAAGFVVRLLTSRFNWRTRPVVLRGEQR